MNPPAPQARSRPEGAEEGRLPITEFTPLPGDYDLAWGHPDPVLLPSEELAETARRTLLGFGSEALAYGAPVGPGPLIEAICQRLALVDARAPGTSEVCITAGVSAALEQVATVLARPGDVVLVEAPTYHFALRILEGHGLQAWPVPVDSEGLVVQALPGILAGLRACGREVRFLYTIPTFHNPTGLTLADPRRQDLVDLAADQGLLLVEDDVYRELSYDGPPPASLWSLAPAGTVLRLGSFAKSLAPGLRVGYLSADESLVGRFSNQAFLHSGGALSHLPALLVATYMAEGGYAANVQRLQAAYRERRDALLQALAEEMPEGTAWTRPGGGYFTWVTLPSGNARDLRPAVREAGSGFIPGPTFMRPGPEGCGPPGPWAAAAERSFRLAWSRFDPASLRESVRRLGRVLRGSGPDPSRSALPSPGPSLYY